jgi:hypothetical protein
MIYIPVRTIDAGIIPKQRNYLKEVQQTIWLENNLKPEDWKYYFDTDTFAFTYAEDATAFKLRFGL